MTKTDNDNLEAKLELRRHFMRTYHADGLARVFDCCQGSGTIWGRLRREFTVARYWGADQKRRAGRLKIDSARVLEAPGWSDDVLDVDTYGAPWRHWWAILEHGRGPLTVFLTVGRGMAAPRLTNMDRWSREALGLRFSRPVPVMLLTALADLGTEYALARAARKGWRTVSLMEGAPGVRARYFGVRLEPE